MTVTDTRKHLTSETPRVMVVIRMEAISESDRHSFALQCLNWWDSNVATIGGYKGRISYRFYYKICSGTTFFMKYMFYSQVNAKFNIIPCLTPALKKVTEKEAAHI